MSLEKPPNIENLVSKPTSTPAEARKLNQESLDVKKMANKQNTLDQQSIEKVRTQIFGAQSEAGNKKVESTREYEASPVLVKDISQTKVIFEKPITRDTKVCLIGDGQGKDTEQFFNMGVAPENIQSVNYEQSEVDSANEGVLAKLGIKMTQGDAVNLESLIKAGVKEGSLDIVTLMHVLEVPNIKGASEKRLVENIKKILKPGGELLVTQYKHKFTKSERPLQAQIGIEEIKAEDLQKQFGENWQQEFKNNFGVAWEPGMCYGEISNIRSKEDLTEAFANDFNIKFAETESEYILKMKKRQ